MKNVGEYMDENAPLNPHSPFNQRMREQPKPNT